MPLPICPSTLPLPSGTAQLTWRDPRRPGMPDGALHEFGAEGRALIGEGDLTFAFTAAETSAFVTWYTTTLQHGASWFSSAWPHPLPATVVEWRIDKPPRLALAAGDVWRMAVHVLARSIPV